MKESVIQTQIVEYLSAISRSHGFLFFSVPNEALPKIAKSLHILDKIVYALMAILKKMGLLPGVSDLVLGWRGKMYCMEVKNEVGEQSENQILFEQWCIDCGIEYRVVRSVHDVSEALIEWGIM